MRRMMTLTLGLVLLCNGAAAQVSTRQQMIEETNQVAKAAYCVGLFSSPMSPAAEHLEIGGHISQGNARKFFDHVQRMAAPSVAQSAMAVTIPAALNDEAFGKQLSERIGRAVDEGKQDANRLSRSQVFQQYDACMPLLKWQTEAEFKAMEQREEQAKAWQQRQQEEQQQAALQQQAEIEAQRKAKVAQQIAAREAREQQQRLLEQQKAAEIEAARNKLRSCWAGHGVALAVSVNEQGRVTQVVWPTSELGNRYQDDRRYRAAHDAAARAITSPQCRAEPSATGQSQRMFTINF